mgnify:CR=1 FL=1
MDLYTLFVSSSVDGAVMPFAYYDNREAAQEHRDHINRAIAKNNPLQAGEAFVRKTSHVVRSTFGGE